MDLGTQQPADSPYHRHLPPAGTVVDARPLVDDDLSCFAEVTLRPLSPMLVPEEPRAGVLDRATCGHCRPSEHTLWEDDHWQVRSGCGRGCRTSAGSPHASTCGSTTLRSS